MHLIGIGRFLLKCLLQTSFSRFKLAFHQYYDILSAHLVQGGDCILNQCCLVLLEF